MIRKMIDVFFAILVFAVLVPAPVAVSAECTQRNNAGSCIDDDLNSAIQNNDEELIRPQWGTSNSICQSINAHAFVPLYSDSTYDSTGDDRYRTGGTNRWFNASPTIPSGAKLQYLYIDYCDTAATDDVWGWFFSCDTLAPFDTCVYYPADNSLKSSGTPGCGYLTLYLGGNNITISNNTNTYMVRVRLDATDNSTRFRDALICYTLQISPAPGTATFWDVPVGSFWHQYVEALAASGITTGYGDGSFQPDAPVTRGQMAAFLSRALGLNWPY